MTSVFKLETQTYLEDPAAPRELIIVPQSQSGRGHGAMANVGAPAIFMYCLRSASQNHPLILVPIIQLLKVKLLPARSVCNFRIPFGAFKLLA